MTNDSKYLSVLCGNFGDDYQPLTKTQFWKIYHQCNDSIENVIDSKVSEVQTLLKRSGSITFAIDKMEQMGIKITTVLDDNFPKKLLTKLGDKCPPILYYCGNTDLNQMKYVGYVGSRDIDNVDQIWTEKMIEKNISKRFGVVSGGARGIDMISTSYALRYGSFAIEFLVDGIDKKIKDKTVLQYILDDKMLLYSATSPMAKKYRNSFVVAAMERNKFIYAQSSGTVVVKSDLNKGGTWAGATEALQNRWCKVYVWDQKKYQGNQALIAAGGIGIDNTGELVNNNSRYVLFNDTKDKEEYSQITLHDLANEMMVSEETTKYKDA